MSMALGIAYIDLMKLKRLDLILEVLIHVAEDGLLAFLKWD